MSNRKRSVITIATINTSGYLNGKKMTNTFVWKVWMIDEKNVDMLLEQERLNIEKGISEQYHASANSSNSVEIQSKIGKIERHFVDSYTTEHKELIGNTREEKATIKTKM
ncbi:MAG: hypothetical protein IKN99_06305 [Bacteroidales bacterium]|nr:hypothetical protein [Bacteroidales bacterium]